MLYCQIRESHNAVLLSSLGPSLWSIHNSYNSVCSVGMDMNWILKFDLRFDRLLNSFSFNLGQNCTSFQYFQRLNHRKYNYSHTQ